MGLIDNISKNIATLFVSFNYTDICDKNSACDEISNDIKYLKELKELLIEKDIHINKQVIEWDRTFDSIIDNIVIINSDLIITKTNKHFIKCMNDHSKCGIYDFCGMSWIEVQKIIDICEDDTTVYDCIHTGITQELYNTKNGQMFHVIVNPVFSEDIVIGAVRISRDISKIEEQKTLLQNKNKILQSVVSITHILESDQVHDVKIYNILEILGKTVKADRSYIYYNKTEKGRLCATFGHEWCSDSFEKCNTVINDCINFDVLIDWRDDLSSGKTIMGGAKKCTNCINKNLCDTNLDGKFSICAVPLFVNKEWIGFIGFDYLSEKTLIDDEEYILRISADILGNVLYRHNKDMV